MGLQLYLWLMILGLVFSFVGAMLAYQGGKYLSLSSKASGVCLSFLGVALYFFGWMVV